MKIKTSITLSDDLLETIDEMAVEYKNRSEFIEIMMRKAIARVIRAKQDARDVILINKHSDEINAEIADALTFQTEI